MEYPVEILPNPAYKIIDCDLADHFLIRHFNADGANDILDPVTGQLKVQHICSPTERIHDLSLSLLGIYQPAHIDLDFTEAGKEKFNHSCPPNEIVDIPVFETEFLKTPGRFYWCAAINKLSNQQFSYTRSNDPFTATCIVMHTPMRWNYWHFSLRWNTDLGDLEALDDRQRRNVAKRIGQSVRVAISRFAVIHAPQSPELSPQCYSVN